MLGQDTAGSTHDFWQALQGWESLGLAGLGSLAENSVRWAAFEDQGADEWARDVREASLGGGVKAARLREWRVEWERFCLWVVTEFGEDDDDDDVDEEEDGDGEGKGVEEGLSGKEIVVGRGKDKAEVETEAEADGSERIGE